MRKLIVEVLFLLKSKLESYTMLTVPPKVICEIENTVDATERIVIQVDWIDRAIEEIMKKRKSFAFG